MRIRFFLSKKIVIRIRFRTHRSSQTYEVMVAYETARMLYVNPWSLAEAFIPLILRRKS